MTSGAVGRLPAIMERAAPSSGPAVFWRRLRRARFGTVGLALALLLVLVAVAGPWLAPLSPNRQDIRQLLQGPSPAHWLGTDDLGRDVLSRVLYGAQVSLLVGLLATGISLAIGVPAGLISGYAGGWVDTVVMRIMDALLAFPAIVLALGITAMLGPSLQNVMIAVGIVGVPNFARLIRGQVLALRRVEFVAAARTVGAGDLRIVVRHILPNTIAVAIIQASLGVATAILAEAGLSFLGLGVQPPTPSWGSMIKASTGYLERAPWMAIGPGVAIFVAVLAYNLLGDAVRDALDPRLKE
jgi:peptide/nickel transport system permease protein